MIVSIITSCYNREKTIRGAVESVLAQDYPDIEYIIVDGASKDESAQIIREAIAGHEDKVKFISEPDHGMYEAINKGIRMATGNVIALMRMGGMSTDSAKRKKVWDEDIRVYSGYGFKPVTLTKLMKMAWKVPQFIQAKFMK